MKKTILACAVVLSLAASIVLVSCSKEAAGYTFGYGSLEANGKTVTIKLEGNPTTGFEWTNVKTGDALVYKSDAYISSGKGTETGAGGTYSYVYEGEKAGTTKITFTYARSWEKNAGDRTVDVEVTTDASGNVVSTKTTCSDGTGGESKS